MHIIPHIYICENPPDRRGLGGLLAIERVGLLRQDGELFSNKAL
jgi:hypothetical protein